jgi:hypothetical protein
MASNSITRKYKKLRDSARGEDCTLQIYPYCNGNPETVVLCHLPSGSGMGQKSPDWFAVYGCSSCHDIIDGRVTNAQIKLFLMRNDLTDIANTALYRTWERMIDKGLIKI